MLYNRRFPPDCCLFESTHCAADDEGGSNGGGSPYANKCVFNLNITAVFLNIYEFCFC